MTTKSTKVTMTRMMITIPVAIGAFGTVSKGSEKWIKDLDIAIGRDKYVI